MTGDRPGGLVVICATVNYDTVKLSDQHIAERLAEHTPVLYVDRPLSHLTPRNQPDTAASLNEPRLRLVRESLWRLTPVVTPFPQRPGVRALTELLVRRALGRAVATIGLDVRALVATWTELDVFGVCGEQLRVWWVQDDYSAGAGLMGLDAQRLRAGERARAAASDMVVVCNPLLADEWRRGGHDVELIPHGADVETFAAVGSIEPAPLISLPTPVAALVGHLNPRVDPKLLEAVADRGISLLLIGPAVSGGSDWLEPLTERPNVQWVGRQPYEMLPSLLAHADVGLVPYGASNFNRGSFPLKTLEYLSAGLPVVATDLPATRWLDADPNLVAIAEDPSGFAAAAQRLAALPMTDAARTERRAFAAAHSFRQRGLDWLAAIERRVADRAAKDSRELVRS